MLRHRHIVSYEEGDGQPGATKTAWLAPGEIR